MKRKRDIQASVISVLAHAALLGGFAVVPLSNVAPPPRKTPPEIVVEPIALDALGAEDAKPSTAEKAEDNKPEEVPLRAERDTPEPTPPPPPKTEPVRAKPVPPVPSKPVKTPVQRNVPKTPERVVTPPKTPISKPLSNTPSPTVNKPQSNTANQNTGQPSRPSAAPAPRTSNEPRPETAAPRPRPTPQPPAPQPRPETPSRPTSNTGTSGASTGAGSTGTGTRDEPSGRPDAPARSGGTGASGGQLPGRSVVRRAMPRHTVLVNATITVRVTVDPEGRVVGATIARKGNPALEAQALSAARGWKWTPLADGGGEINQTTTITFRFEVE